MDSHHAEWDPASEKSPIDPLLAWLTDHFHDLADEGQAIVTRYWKGLRALEDAHPYQMRSTLGLRMRLRDNLAISLEWYLMGTLGRTQRSIARVHITKGRKQDTYSLKTLMRRQPVWLADFVEEIETDLTRIRIRQSRLIRIRDALGEFIKVEKGPGATGSKIMTQYLARDLQSETRALRT